MSIDAGPDDEAPPARDARSRRGQIIRSALSAALVVAIFVFVLPNVADFSEVWRNIRDMTWLEMTTLLAISVWNLCTYGLLWMAALPGLTFAQAMVSTQASTAVTNTVPGGSYISIGITYGMLYSWGFRRSIITLGLLITGIWNNFAKLAIPVLALCALALQGSISTGRVFAAASGFGGLIAAVVLFALALRTPASAARIGNASARVVSWLLRLIRRPPVEGWDIAVMRFREKTIDLLRERWQLITIATIVSHLSLYLVLLMTLRHIGVSEADVGWAEVLAVFSFARLVTAIPLTPGGVGVVELALTTGLTAAGGEESQVVAAVLVFRGLTYLLPVPIGALCFIYARRNQSWRRPVTQSTPTDAVATA